jgi:hypothetical protein
MGLRASLALLCVVSAALVGCGSMSSGAGLAPPSADAGEMGPGTDAAAHDAGADVPMGPVGYPAPHPPLPKVVNAGGPVLGSPVFIPITFPADTFEEQIDDFAAKVGSSTYWTGNMKEYGVGAATMRTAVHFPTNPFHTTEDDSDLQAWLTQQIANGALPPYVFGNIYALFMPDAVSVTLDGSTSCQDFGGYHGEASLSAATSVPYAVIPRCGTYAGLTGIDTLTGCASHEFIEASTDPFPETEPAYAQVDSEDVAWMLLLGGGEIADMCAQNLDAFFEPTGLGYTVQRTWSNSAAAASDDPCIPAPSGAYFNAAPVLPDEVTLNLGAQVTTLAVQIPVGGSKTIPVDLFSNEAMGAWDVTTYDGAGLEGLTDELSLKLDKTSGENGDKLQLTVTVLRGGQGDIETFALASQTRTNVNLWIGLVSSQ